ncbi:MAG: hypothetical protein Ta2D_12150 [Rickettsiales bacterium]|nr:MAG: hypothetical protein Ta2D_12150 [Rickettsiales bacterium]
MLKKESTEYLEKFKKLPLNNRIKILNQLKRFDYKKELDGANSCIFEFCFSKMNKNVKEELNHILQRQEYIVDNIEKINWIINFTIPNYKYSQKELNLLLHIDE